MLALRHKAALLPAHTDRLGRFHYRLTIEAPVLLDQNLRRNEIVEAAVREYAQRLNARVLQNPGDFEWNNLWVRNLASDYRDL
jgi:lauroyl/myristoyl acyltransferase